MLSGRHGSEQERERGSHTHIQMDVLYVVVCDGPTCDVRSRLWGAAWTCCVNCCDWHWAVLATLHRCDVTVAVIRWGTVSSSGGQGNVVFSSLHWHPVHNDTKRPARSYLDINQIWAWRTWKWKWRRSSSTTNVFIKVVFYFSNLRVIWQMVRSSPVRAWGSQAVPLMQ